MVAVFLANSYAVGAPVVALLEYRYQLFSQRFGRAGMARTELATGMSGARANRRAAGLLALVLLGACTYGPEEERRTVEQVLRLGDGYEAVVVVRLDRFRPPTGLTAFPDGGKTKMLERRARLYVVDAVDRTVRVLAELSAPDDVWEAYDVHIRALAGDSVAYVASTGCPKGGECHPALGRTHLLRVVTATGEATHVERVPAGAGLPGIMVARAPGEDRYVRWSREGATVTVLLEEGGQRQPVFEVRADGSLAVIEPPVPADRAPEAGPCEGPDADPWVAGLRDRTTEHDGLARWAVESYGPPIACDGAVTDEFDGASFGIVTLDFAGGVALTVETMPPEVSIVSLGAPAGFADPDGVLEVLRAYAAERGLSIPWDTPEETVTEGSRTTTSYRDPDMGLNGSAVVVLDGERLVEVRVMMAP